MSKKANSTLRRDSWLVAAGRDLSPGSALNVPLMSASNFILGDGRVYARDDGTPVWEAFEAIIGGLDGGSAVAYATGMAAVAAVFQMVPDGSHIVLPEDCYQGVVALARLGEKKGQWRISRLPVEDTESWIGAGQTADLVWIESPSNPLLAVANLERIGGAPRKRGCILAVDNTFATPLNQRPLALGADVSVQSVTKYIGGHSDLLGGVATTTRREMLEQLKLARELSGATPGALETYLAIRGVRTMAVRFERAQESALELASRLERHPQVAVCRYPGLSSHPTHAIASTQLGGFGAIVSFDVKGGAEAADTLCQRVNLIHHATSLGAVESTMERRAANPGQEHLPAGLIRLSVGIENVEDLWDDLSAALEQTSHT